MDKTVVVSRSTLAEFWLFIALTFALSWGFYALLWLISGGSEPIVEPGPIGAFGPPLAAAILTWRIHGSLSPFWSKITRWRIGAGWWMAVLVMPLAILAIGWVVMAIRGLPLFPDTTPQLWLMPLFLVFMLLFGGGQEEPGWRGFALPRLQAEMSALWASVIIGILWAAWHLPLFYFAGSGQANLNLVIYFPYVIAISIIHTWIYNNSGGSVLAVMFLHAMVNLIGGFIPMGVIVEAEVATLIGAWIVAGAVLIIYGPSNLSRKHRLQISDLDVAPVGSERRPGRIEEIT